MPWKDTSRYDEQVRSIERYEQWRVTFVELCRQFGISRKIGHQRLRRFEAYGGKGLVDLSRAPHSHPNATPKALADRLIEAKQGYSTWGPKKLVARLWHLEPDIAWLAPSKAGDILQRAGLVRPRRRRRHAAPWSEPFAAAERPNDVWSIDFKGWFRTQNGRRIDPLTAEDAASRYLLVCDGLSRSNGLGSLTPLAAWWVKLGIMPERVDPGHPERNGRLERLHRTLKAETASPPRTTMRRRQRAFDALHRTYNKELPHEALGQQPPANRYTPSYRSYPSKIESPEYEIGVTVRRARSNRQIKWKGNMIYLSESLRGEPIRPGPPRRAVLEHPVRTLGNRAVGQSCSICPAYTYESVTYVPGQAVTYLIGCTGEGDNAAPQIKALLSGYLIACRKAIEANVGPSDNPVHNRTPCCPTPMQ